MSNLTAEAFETACGGSITAGRVTQNMLDMASTIDKAEATRLLKEPACNWWSEPIVLEIEAAVLRCQDRHVQAVLTVAASHGADGWDNHHRVA
jgi:hypothetical protein